MQYKCRPFFVFMGKTEEFCCPEIQTHILHDKMIMKKEKTYSRAPLPFVGQKRMFVSEFKKILKHFDDKTIFVDLFGGSGLLSHITKRERPDAVVIYNDHDNYRGRLENIGRTNTLLGDLRKIVGIYPHNQKITGKMREAFLERIRLEETTGFVDYLTLSTSLLFSGKYAQNMEELEHLCFYNKIRQADYRCDGYLDGLEVVCYDYKELAETYRVLPGVVFLVDPPYMGTDISTYRMDWKLGDYLDVLPVLKGHPFVYFTSSKSPILDFCKWMEEHPGKGNPFKGTGRSAITARMNYNSSYTDIMLYNNMACTA